MEFNQINFSATTKNEEEIKLTFLILSHNSSEYNKQINKKNLFTGNLQFPLKLNERKYYFIITAYLLQFTI